ncbi:Arm DNA-binding domain-containing protein [Aeromonas veronii]|uniref:Arm DNA-binding domain-containing protein n=2 Tax=Aeromonas veronii TaxID=654 RepID=UPI001F1B34E7|nr:Arm DNA-binding domain-containing protein [Aeromonas veronii]
MALLTDTKARNLKLGDKAIAHGGVTGLALHPSTAKGRGNWVLRYVSPVTGKRRNAGLGSYPEISIADATKQGQKMREQLANGLDPLELKRAEESKCSGQLNPDTWLGRSSAFAGGIPSLY